METSAPTGFVLNSEAQTVTFTYKDQETPVIEQTATFENERQKVEISVEKQDADTEKQLQGQNLDFMRRMIWKLMEL